LTKKQHGFVWNEDCQVAFEKLIQSLMNTSILVYSYFAKPFIFDADASNDAVGTVLSQKNESGEQLLLTQVEHCQNQKENIVSLEKSYSQLLIL
jgi:hypothetical protein